MFDFLEYLTFGERFEFEGIEYIQVKHLQGDLVMAVRAKDELPATVYIVVNKKTPVESQNMESATP